MQPGLVFRDCFAELTSLCRSSLRPLWFLFPFTRSCITIGRHGNKSFNKAKRKRDEGCCPCPSIITPHLRHLTHHLPSLQDPADAPFAHAPAAAPRQADPSPAPSHVATHNWVGGRPHRDRRPSSTRRRSVRRGEGCCCRRFRGREARRLLRLRVSLGRRGRSCLGTMERRVSSRAAICRESNHSPRSSFSRFSLRSSSNPSIALAFLAFSTSISLSLNLFSLASAALAFSTT